MPKRGLNCFMCCCRLDDEEEDNALQYQNIPKPRANVSISQQPAAVEKPVEDGDALEYMNIPTKSTDKTTTPQPVSSSTLLSSLV